MKEAHLKRSISLFLLIMYGIGTVLGAGIYALIGKIIQQSNFFAPFSFLVALIVAAFTALSYSELSSRYPQSAGAALYAQQAFGRIWLSATIGWLLIITGIVSTAVLANAFVGYLQLFVALPSWLIILIVVTSLGLLAIWGISQSVIAVSVMTIIEVSGLLLVIYVGADSFKDIAIRWPEFIPTFELTVWHGIIMGGFLAFYAFIGFEDMVNVAEEVKNPRSNLPIAIVVTLSITAILYILVSLTALLTLPIAQLVHSDAPLALIIQSKGYSPTIIGVISLFAILNSALVQIIMASRIVYGMSRQGGSPLYFLQISEKTQTPVRATILITSIVLILALGFSLVTLAKTNSFIILFVFMMVNFTLLVIKRKKPIEKKAVCFPIIVPIIGSILCALLILSYITSMLI